MDDGYKTPFSKRAEDPNLREPLTDEARYFSASLTPLLGHRELMAATTAEQHRAFEIQQLFAYLDFTVRLETEPVNQVAHLLSRPAFIPWLHPARRLDALRVYEDEGKHAKWSARLIDDVVAETDIHPLDVEPGFLTELDQLIENEPSSFGEFVKLFFVIVSETLITGSLNRLPADPEVQLSVRNLAKAHAQDEGQHHRYFKSLFGEMWPTLPYQTRIRIGTLLPSMLEAFLLPDRAYMRSVLDLHAPDVAEPDRIVDEIVSSELTREGLRNSAAPSLRMFDDAGVFADPIITESFVRHQFLLPAPA